MAREDRQGLEILAGLVLPEDELRIAATRSGGPGGQNVNKVATRVTLRFAPKTSRALSEDQRERLAERLAGRLTRTGEVVIHASRHRERRRNEEDARERLRALLRDALQETKERHPTRPTRGSKERRLAEKRRRSEKKRLRGPDDEA